MSASCWLLTNYFKTDTTYSSVEDKVSLSHSPLSIPEINPVTSRTVDEDDKS